MSLHKVQVVGGSVVVVMVSGEEEVRLAVLVGAWVGGGGRLHGLGEAGEVELVGVSFSVYLRHDVLVVVIA